MRIFLEFDGIFTDLKTAWWQAYRTAVAQTGLAATDEVTFWRLLRTGADDGQLIKGAKDHHIKAFRKYFEDAIEQDDVVLQQEFRSGLGDLVKRLERFGACSLITLGSNISVRRDLLARHNLAFLGDGMKSLPLPALAVAAKLQSLMEADTQGVVLASSEPMVRAAEKAGMKPLGIAGGTAIARRLAQSGAIATFSNLSVFNEALAEGTIDGFNRFR